MTATIVLEPSYRFDGTRKPDTESACTYSCPCGHEGENWTHATLDGHVAVDCDACDAVLISR